MEVFINEKSLNNQFSDNHSFIESIKILISSLDFISNIKQEKKIFKSLHFFYFTGFNDSNFESCLKKNPQINSAFSQCFNRINPKNWENQKIHKESSTYQHDSIEYVNTSVAELAELNLLNDGNPKGFLINFNPSYFSNKSNIDILKDSEYLISVHCTCDPDSIHQWLIENKIIQPEKVYNEDSKLAPLDIQTVLCNSSHFELTNLKNKGRKVYKRIGFNEYWSVDNSKRHAGKKAHLEVFSSTTGKHLGTSLYSEIKLNTDYVDNTRYLDL